MGSCGGLQCSSGRDGWHNIQSVGDERAQKIYLKFQNFFPTLHCLLGLSSDGGDLLTNFPFTYLVFERPFAMVCSFQIKCTWDMKCMGAVLMYVR